MPPKHPDPSILKTIKAQFSIELHPSKLENVSEGVREQLNASLLRYNEDFEGVVIAYHNERILSEKALVHPYFPLCHVDVAADVVLFQPKVGSYLVGTVNKIGNDHISLLVYGVFVATIAADHIRSEFRCNMQAEEWRSTADSSHVIGIGSQVQFKVEMLQDLDHHYEILGSLQDPYTGEVSKVHRAPQQKQQEHAQQANGHAGQQQQQQQKAKRKDKKEKRRVEREQAKQQAQQQQHQQQQQEEEQDGVKSSKKDKPMQQQVENGKQAAAAPAAAAPAPAAPAAAAEQPSSKKHKQKDKSKDKVKQKPAAEADTAGSQQQEKAKSEKKRKHKDKEGGKTDAAAAAEGPKPKKQKQHKDKAA